MTVIREILCLPAEFVPSTIELAGTFIGGGNLTVSGAGTVEVPAANLPNAHLIVKNPVRLKSLP
jgi:hypothetical protein